MPSEGELKPAVADDSYLDTEPGVRITPEQEEARRWQKIRELNRDSVILEGTVTEIRPGKKAYYAVTDLLGFDVLIPDSWFITDSFFNGTYAQASPEEKAKRRHQALRAALGARVCYVLKTAERTSDGYVAAGSRVEACRMKRERFFLSEDISEEKRITPGSMIKCRVLTVGENGVRAEAYGVDFYVNRRQLGLTHPILDARDWFSPGDSFTAVVQKIYINEDDSVYLQASVRQLEHERIKDGYKQATPGSTVSGYVCDYNPERKSYTMVLSCGCYANVHKNSVVGGETLALGDSVSVQIKEIRTGFVTGTAMKINNIAKPRNMIYSWD